MIKILIFITLLLIFCFLYTLNLFLRGRLKEALGGILGLLIVVVVVISFFLLGWRIGLLLLVLPFISIPLFQPIASRIAYKLLGYRTGIHDNDNSALNIEKFMGGKLSLDELFKKSRQQEESAKRRLENIARKIWIADILNRHGLSNTDFEELYKSLHCSVLHDLT